MREHPEDEDDAEMYGEYGYSAEDVRRRIAAFLSWLCEQEEGVILRYVTTQGPDGREKGPRLEEVVTDEEIAGLIRDFEDWEADEAVRAAEARYD
jgi:hypothetical protein